MQAILLSPIDLLKMVYVSPVARSVLGAVTPELQEV